MSQNIALGSLPFLDVYGLQIAWASTTTLTMQSGQARDSNNAIDIVLDDAVTINSAVNGINGLDTGDLANSTWYYVFLIGSSLNYKQPAALISASATPLMPAGYDSYRRIGFALTDGSAHFLKFYVYGNNSLRKYYWDAVVTELSAGASTSFADVNLASSVAPTATLAHLNWAFTPATAGNIAKLRVNGSSSTTNITMTGSVAAKANTGTVLINTDASQVIEYIVENASDALTLYAIGFDDFI
jgi:hypothetical protein